jgi:hypothetical protein
VEDARGHAREDGRGLVFISQMMRGFPAKLNIKKQFGGGVNCVVWQQEA